MTIPGETLHYSKSFTIVWEEGPAKVLSDKDPAPPPPEINNLAAPPFTSEDSIEAVFFNSSNWTEYISLVRNQGLDVDDDMEPEPNNFPLVHTLAA